MSRDAPFRRSHSSAARARESLLPVGPDPRRPMREIYQMFRGAFAPEAVLHAAAGDPAAQFYAQLYVGLYYEALGDERRAREHIEAAAAPRFAAVGGDMHEVARLHLVFPRPRRLFRLRGAGQRADRTGKISSPSSSCTPSAFRVMETMR